MSVASTVSNEQSRQSIRRILAQGCRRTKSTNDRFCQVHGEQQSHKAYASKGQTRTAMTGYLAARCAWEHHLRCCVLLTETTGVAVLELVARVYITLAPEKRASTGHAHAHKQKKTLFGLLTMVGGSLCSSSPRRHVLNNADVASLLAVKWA